MAETENPDFNKINQILIDYYSDPQDNRSLVEVAKDSGISEATLYRHKKQYHKQIFDAVERNRAKFIPELRAKGYKALGQRLNGKSQKPLELLFKLTGDLVERVEQVNKYETLEQKREKLGELLAKAGIQLNIIPPENKPK